MAINTPYPAPDDKSPQDGQLDAPGDPNAAVAADLIREKVSRIYAEEPAAEQELAEAQNSPHRSKHQQFMYELSGSGKDLAAIQTEWHDYYQSLPASEKHQVWQEFYDSQSALTRQPAAMLDPQSISEHKQQATKFSILQKTP